MQPGRLPPLLVSALSAKQPLAAEPMKICSMSTEQYVSRLVSKSTLYLPIYVNCVGYYHFFIGCGEINMDLLKSYLSNLVYGGEVSVI
jgi:hypothetical protein